MIGLGIGIPTKRIISSAGLDPSAQAFITVHEADTGLTMGTTQRNAVNLLVRQLKGLESGYTDLWSQMASRGVFLAIYCPSTNSAASAAGYAINLINPAEKITWVGFVTGDFSPFGLTGGTGKYGNVGKAPLSFNQNIVGHYCYSRTNLTIAAVSFGSSVANTDPGLTAGTVMVLRNSPDNFYYTKVNRAGGGWDASGSAMTSSQGLFGIKRNGTSYQLTRNGVVIASNSVAAAGSPSSFNFYIHALNGGGTLLTPDTRQYAGYYIGIQYLNPTEETNFYNAIQTFQTNVITGGRQVV